MLLLLLASACIPNTALDRGAIRSAIEASVSVEGAPITIKRIVVSGDYALGIFDQGGQQNDILLARRGRRWSMMLCATAPIRDRGELLRAGVPWFAAEMLAKQVAEPD